MARETKQQKPSLANHFLDMAFGIRYVPISPGMYDRAPPSNFPDLNNFVSIEILMQAKKNIDEFLASTPLEDKQTPFHFEPVISHDAVPARGPQSIENPDHDETDEYFKFLLENDSPWSNSPSSMDDSSDSSMESSHNTTDSHEDMSWDFSQNGVFQDAFQDAEIWDPTPVLEALISSTECMDQATLYSLEKSLEEFESLFAEAVPTTEA